VSPPNPGDPRRTLLQLSLQVQEDCGPTVRLLAPEGGAVCAASVAVLKEKRSNGSSRRQTGRTSEAMRGGCSCGAEQGAVGAAQLALALPLLSRSVSFIPLLDPMFL